MSQATFPCGGRRTKRKRKTRAVFSRVSSKHTPAHSCRVLLWVFLQGSGWGRWSRGCKNTDLKVARREGYRTKFFLVLITPLPHTLVLISLHICSNSWVWHLSPSLENVLNSLISLFFCPAYLEKLQLHQPGIFFFFNLFQSQKTSVAKHYWGCGGGRQEITQPGCLNSLEVSDHISYFLSPVNSFSRSLRRHFRLFSSSYRHFLLTSLCIYGLTLYFIYIKKYIQRRTSSFSHY